MKHENTLHQLPGVILSDCRIVQTIDETGYTYRHSILLRNITSIQVFYRRSFKYLWLAILVLLMGILIYNAADFTTDSVFNYLFAIAVIFFGAFLILFFFDTEKSIHVKSANSEMKIYGNFNAAQALDFSEKIDQAILKYINGQASFL